MFRFLNKLEPLMRLRLLAVFLTLLVFCAWQFSFKKTWLLYKQSADNQSYLARAETIPRQLAEYRKNLTQLESTFNRQAFDRETIFGTINTYCRDSNLQILNYFPERREHKGALDVVTTQVQVQGGYKAILQLVYFIEAGAKLGHIASVNFLTQENKREYKTYLTGDIYFQYLAPFQAQ